MVGSGNKSFEHLNETVVETVARVSVRLWMNHTSVMLVGHNFAHKIDECRLGSQSGALSHARQ